MGKSRLAREIASCNVNGGIFIFFGCIIILQVALGYPQGKNGSFKVQRCDQTALKHNLLTIFSGLERTKLPHKNPLKYIVCVTCNLTKNENCNSTTFVHKAKKAVQEACGIDICKVVENRCHKNKTKTAAQTKDKPCNVETIKRKLYSTTLYLKTPQELQARRKQT